MTSLFGSSWSAARTPNLAQKVYLVTGGSAGIGFGICVNLLQHNPAKILMLSHKQEQADLARKELEKYGDTQCVEWIQCNLEDLKEVDKTAKDLRNRLDRLDALICNAGLGVGVYNESKDGIDTHFQVNHLSQMHLALTLLPILQKTARENHDARLVLQSSEFHKATPSSTQFASLDEINQDIGPSYLYNRSKLAQILFARGLVKRLESGELPGGVEGLWINTTHPGAVSTTQPQQAEEAYGVLGKAIVAASRPFMKDPITQGCLPALFAATAPEVVSNRIQSSYITPPATISEPSKQAQDEGLEKNLWTLSSRLLQDKVGSVGNLELRN